MTNSLGVIPFLVSHNKDKDREEPQISIPKNFKRAFDARID